MIDDVVRRWHLHLRGELEGGLDELLDDDVVFYSPVVYTPQRGKDITKLYLTAAGATFSGSNADGESADHDTATGGGFRYTKQVVSGDTAVFEFETTMNGKYVNGVDIIRANDEGRIVEFRVMLRPLQAVNAVHEIMKRQLEALQAGQP